MTARQVLVAEYQSLCAANTAAILGGAKRLQNDTAFCRMVFLGKLLK